MKILRTICLFAVTLLLSACGATNEIYYEGGDLVWISTADAFSLDPHRTNDIPSLTFQSQIFEGLVTFNAYDELIPKLAESFEMIDPTTWQFDIRRGVYFSDGYPLNAYAVVRSFQRFVSDELASPGAAIIDMVTGFYEIDNYTVHITTLFPFSPLPSHLTTSGGFIVSPASINAEENGTIYINENPIGTGPFLLYHRNHGYDAVFIRNDNYWGISPYINTLTIRSIPESATRLAMIEAGEAHGLNAAAVEIPAIRYIPHASYMTRPGAFTEYIAFNVRNEGPLQNPLVRQAIALAIDLDEMIQIMEGLATPAATMAGPLIAFSPTNVSPIEFNQQLARELLEQTPYAYGTTLNFWYNSGSAIRTQIAELVHFYLAQIGIEVEILSMEFGAYLAAIAEGEHDMFVLNWGATTGDADRAFHPLYHSSNHGAAGNRSFINDLSLDTLLDTGREASDPQQRYQIYEEIAYFLHNEIPMLPLWHITAVFAYSGIEGLEFDIFRSLPRFTNVRIID